MLAGDTTLASVCLASGVVLRNLAAALTELLATAVAGNGKGHDTDAVMEILISFAIHSPSCRDWMAQVPSFKKITEHARFGKTWTLLLSMATSAKTNYSADEALEMFSSALAPATSVATTDAATETEASESSTSAASRSPLPAEKLEIKNVEWTVAQLHSCQSCLHKFKHWTELLEKLKSVASDFEARTLKWSSVLRRDDATPTEDQMSTKEREDIENIVIAMKNVRRKIKTIAIGSKRD